MCEQETIPGPGSPGTEDVWKSIDRAYDTEYRHQQRSQRLLARQVTMTTQIFQSQMLGLMLLGESEQLLVPDDGQTPSENEPTAAKGAVTANPRSMRKGI